MFQPKYNQNTTLLQRWVAAGLKFSKRIDVIKKLQNILQRQALLTIYKSFATSHLDHEDIIYDGLHKLIWLFYNWRIKSSKNFMRNYAVLVLFLKIALWTRLTCLYMSVYTMYACFISFIKREKMFHTVMYLPRY